MSRIFAAVSVSTVLLVAVAALTSASQDVETQSESFDQILGLFATQLEVAALVPIALLVGLSLAALAVVLR